MQTEYVDVSQRRLRVKYKDSLGRTKEQAAAMDQNAVKPVKLREEDLEVAELIASNASEFPKVLYHRAVRNGVAVGDEISPDYQMPVGTAELLGLDDVGFKVIGRKRQDGTGHVVVRHPWITRVVGTVREDLTVDVEAARAEEKELRAKGWVSHPSQLKNLPVLPGERPYDPEDDEPKPNGNGRGKAA